jgi:hypothetical protein
MKNVIYEQYKKCVKEDSRQGRARKDELTFKKAKELADNSEG